MFQSTSAKRYSASPSPHYDVIRLIQGHPKPWINLESSNTLQKKKLILSFSPDDWWYLLNCKKIAQVARQLLQDGFELYLLQYHKSFVLNLENVDCLQESTVFRASFTNSSAGIIEEFLATHHASLEQIFILDNYWMETLIQPQVERPPRALNFSHLTQLNTSIIGQVIHLQQTLDPPLSCIYNDMVSYTKVNHTPAICHEFEHDGHSTQLIHEYLREYAPQIPIINKSTFLSFNASDLSLAMESLNFSDIKILHIQFLKTGQQYLLSQFPNLTWLQISYNFLSIDDFPCMPQVKHLSLLNCKNFNLETLMQKFPQLEELTLNIQPPEIKLIAHTWSLSPGHPLKFFKLYGGTNSHVLPHTTSFELNQMLRVTTQLKTLILENCNLQTLNDCPKLKEIYDASSTEKKDLNIYYCPIYPRLEHFNFNCRQILFLENPDSTRLKASTSLCLNLGDAKSKNLQLFMEELKQIQDTHHLELNFYSNFFDPSLFAARTPTPILFPNLISLTIDQVALLALIKAPKLLNLHLSTGWWHPNLLLNQQFLQNFNHLHILSSDDIVTVEEFKTILTHTSQLKCLQINLNYFLTLENVQLDYLTSLYLCDIDDSCYVDLTSNEFFDLLVLKLSSMPRCQYLIFDNDFCLKDGYSNETVLSKPLYHDFFTQRGIKLYFPKYKESEDDKEKQLETQASPTIVDKPAVIFNLEDKQQPEVNPPFHFVPSMDDFSQEMIINRFSQYLTLIEPDSQPLINKIQPGICLALSFFFIKAEQAEWEQFMQDLLTWKGGIDDLGPRLKEKLAQLHVIIIQFYHNPPIWSVDYLGPLLKTYLQDNKAACILTNPWHAIALKPSNLPQLYLVYDPSDPEKEQWVETEKLISYVQAILGLNISVFYGPARKFNPLLPDINTFLIHGGLAFLNQDPSIYPLFEARFHEINYTRKSVLKSFTLITVNNQAFWSYYLNQLTVFILISLQHFHKFHAEEAQNLLYKSLGGLSLEQLKEIATFLQKNQRRYAPKFGQVLALIENVFALKRASLLIQDQLKPATVLVEEDFISKILNSSKILNRLVEFKHASSLQGFIYKLNLAAEQRALSLFTIDDVSQLACPNPHIAFDPKRQVASLSIGPGGRLFDFLEQAKKSAKRQVICINYSRFSPSDIVKTNTIFDQERKIDGINIPDNIVIIALLNLNDKQVYRGQDFYSRMQQIDQNHYNIAELQSIIPSIQPKPLAADEALPIKLYQRNDWREILVGRWQLENQDLRFIDGQLTQALRQGKTAIALHQANWHDPEFLEFWQNLGFYGRLQLPHETLVVPQAITLYHQEKYDLRPYQAHDFIASIPFAALGDYYYLNPTLMPQFFGDIAFDGDGQIHTVPGYLERHQLGKIQIYLNRDLNLHQWAQFLDTCLMHKIKIELFTDQPSCLQNFIPDFSPQDRVSLAKPWSLAATPAPVSFIQTTDAYTSLAQLQSAYTDALSLNISELSSADLLFKLQGRFDPISLTLKFEQQASILTNQTTHQSTIILYGEWPKDLLDQLLPWLQTTKRQVFILNADAGEIVGFSHFHHKVTISEKIAQLKTIPASLTPYLASESLAKLQARLRFLALYPERHSDENWQGLKKIGLTEAKPSQDFSFSQAESQAHAFFAQRLSACVNQLKHQPYIFLSGLSGVGKSTFIQETLAALPQYTIFYGEDKIKAWATTRPESSDSQLLLFIDEANLSQRQWTEFDGLFYPQPGILIDGGYYPLSHSHRVVFAGNPLNYGDERQLATLFQCHGQTLMFQPLSAAVIYHDILGPIWQASKLARWEQKLSQKIINIYLFLSACSSEHLLISPRELSMMAALTVNSLESQPGPIGLEQALRVVDHYIFQIGQTLIPAEHRNSFLTKFAVSDPLAPRDFAFKNFILMEKHQDLVKMIDDILLLRQANRLNGLGGLVIEGVPGVGKSELIKEIINLRLADQSKLTILPASLGLSEKEKALRQSFDQGAIVIMDEMNATVMMERLVNALLMGRTPEGEPPKSPGFLLISTQNSAAQLAGRQQMSPALARRMLKLSMPGYARDDVQEIAQAFGLPQDIAEELAAQYTKPKYQHDNQAISFRSIITLIKKLVKIHIKHLARSQLIHLYHSKPPQFWRMEENQILSWRNRSKSILNRSNRTSINEIQDIFSEYYRILSPLQEKKRLAPSALNTHQATIQSIKKVRVDSEPSTGIQAGFRFFPTASVSISSLPDGNCAFNAMVLFLRESFLTLNSDHPFLAQAQSILQTQAQLFGTITAVKDFFSSQPSQDLQRNLAPIIRQMIVNWMSKPENNYQTLLFERITNMLQYRETAVLASDLPDADTFLVHPFIERKYAELIIYPIEVQISRMQSWWDTEGFQTYLAAIQSTAQGANDQSRWGGAIEMDTFGKIFQVSVKISKNHRGHEYLGKDEATIEAQFGLEAMHWSYLGQKEKPAEAPCTLK